MFVSAASLILFFTFFAWMLDCSIKDYNADTISKMNSATVHCSSSAIMCSKHSSIFQQLHRFYTLNNNNNNHYISHSKSGHHHSFKPKSLQHGFKLSIFKPFSAKTSKRHFRGFCSVSTAQESVKQDPILLESPSSNIPRSLQSAHDQLQSFPEYSDARQSLKRGQFPSAKTQLLRAKQIFQSLPDQSLHIIILRCLASTARDMADFKAEIKFRTEILQMLSKQSSDTPLAQDTQLLIQTISSLSIALFRTNQFEIAQNMINQHSNKLKTGDTTTPVAFVLQFLQAALFYSSGAVPELKKKLNEIEKLLQNWTPSEQHFQHYRLLFEGDLQLLYGYLHSKLLNQAEQATLYYQKSVEIYEKLPSKTIVPTSNIKQVPLIQALSAINDENSLSRALQLVETELGENSYELSEILRRLGNYYFQRVGDAISSEGLFRSSIAKLEHLHYPQIQNSTTKLILLNSYLDYAALLTELSWNNKSRKPEAKHFMQKALQILQQFPQLEPTYREFPVSIEIIETGDNNKPAAQNIPKSPFTPTTFTDSDYQLKLKNQPKLEQWIIDRYTV